MREKWLKLYLEQGLPITEVAKLSGLHPDTLYIWKRNYLGTGIEGLVEQSRAPHRHPNEYSNDIKEKIRLLRKDGKGICANIIKIRLAKRYGIRISRSGIADFLSKDGLVNAKLSRRIKNKKERIKKCKIHDPGEMAQVDVKYAFKSFANYWFYQYSAAPVLKKSVRYPAI